MTIGSDSMAACYACSCPVFRFLVYSGQTKVSCYYDVHEQIGSITASLSKLYVLGICV